MEQVDAAQIHSAVTFGFWLAVALFLYFFLGHVEEDGGPTRLSRWLAAWREPRAVNRSTSAAPDYDNRAGRDAAPRSAFPASAPTETEKRAEAETAETDPDRVVMPRETFDRLLAQARAQGYLDGGADVFGGLLGGGYLAQVEADKQITEAKTFVFVDADGKPASGRTMTAVINPRIRAAEARARARRPEVPEELRVVGINAHGERQEVPL